MGADYPLSKKMILIGYHDSIEDHADGVSKCSSGRFRSRSVGTEFHGSRFNCELDVQIGGGGLWRGGQRSSGIGSFRGL
jgi:hypothetical protein